MEHRGRLAALAWVLLIGGLWRGLEALARYHEPLGFGDEHHYFALGLGLRDGGLLADPTRPWRPSARRGPLYPALVGAAAGPGDRPGRVRILNAALSTLGLLLLYALGAALHSPLAGLAAAGLAAASVPAAAWSGTVFIETAFGFLVLCAAGAFAWWAKEPSRSSSAALGLAIGTSLLCRSNLAFLPLLAAAFAWRDGRGAGLRAAAPALVLAAIALLPWVARNAWWFGRLIVLEDRPATPLVYLATAGAVRAAPHATFSVERTELLELQEGELSRAEDIEELYDRMSALARRNLLERPGVFARAWAARCLVIAATFGRAITWPCAALLVAGLGLLRGPPWRELYACLGCFLGLYSLLAFQDRYVLPALPIGQLLAGAAAAELAARFSGATASPAASLLERRTFAGCALLVGLLAAGSWWTILREFGVPRALASRVHADEGWRLVEGGRPAEALDAFARARANAPKSPEPSVGLATAGLALGRPSLAELNEAIRLSYRPWAATLDGVTAAWAIAAFNARAGVLEARGRKAAAAADRMRAARLRAGQGGHAVSAERGGG